MVALVVSFRRPLHVVALALCSMAVFAVASPALARPHHGAGRHARAYHAGHRARRQHDHRHHRHVARLSRRERSWAQMQARGFAGAQASVESNVTPAAVATPGSFGSSNIVAEARRYLGGNPTGMGRLWCARFMNLVLKHSGYHGTGSDMARSFASYGRRVSGPQVGAIAVMARRGGGHVGVVSGIDASGNPIVVSGNSRNRVREAPISRGRIYAYVMPTS
jgi:uncharacterized protein (TIGR02594 family)